MSIQYAFPFCVISDLGITKTVNGTVTITTAETSVSNDFGLTTRTWQDQQPDQTILITDSKHSDSKLTFIITVEVNDPDAVIVIFAPESSVKLIALKQNIVGTDFKQVDQWYRLPLHNDQTAVAVVQTFIHETPDTAIDRNINFRETLTYVERLTTNNLDIIDYLGKDNLKNKFFNKQIPATDFIPARPNTEQFKWAGDTTEYRYNALGYRSNIEYTTNVDQVILCLGDSDSFGIGINNDNIWPTLIQQETNTTVYNLSVLGASVDSLTRIAVQTIQALENKVVAVLMHYPPMSLREFVSKQYKGGVHTHRNYNLPYADWWDHIDWQSNNYNFNKNRLLLENICLRFNIKYFDLHINREDPKVPLDFNEYGVYSCLGPKTHRAIANYFIKKLQ